MRLEITTPATPAPLQFALSPNGRHIVFVASGDGQPRLWLRPLDRTEAQPMAGTEGAQYPFWSADSRSIGFFGNTRLYRIDIGGGSPQVLANTAAGRGGTWNADGTILFAPTVTSGLSRIAASGGEPEAVTRLDPPRQVPIASRNSCPMAVISSITCWARRSRRVSTWVRSMEETPGG